MINCEPEVCKKKFVSLLLNGAVAGRVIHFLLKLCANLTLVCLNIKFLKNFVALFVLVIDQCTVYMISEFSILFEVKLKAIKIIKV